MNLLVACLLASHAATLDTRDDFLQWARSRDAAHGDTPIEEPYHQQHELWSEVADLVQTHPQLEVERIGASLHGTPLWAIHVRPPEFPRRNVLVFAGIHAMEWISTETALAYLHTLVDTPPVDIAVTVIPLLNPDGREKVELDLAAGANTYRRGNLHNVDLNRDFAWHRDKTSAWHNVLPGYHATSTRPLSQPESRALDGLAAREHYDRSASLHAFGGFFYYPWSGTWQRPADWAAFVHLGHAMERAQGPRAYKTRQLSRWAFFFRAHGSEIDHLYGEYGTLSFLIELTRSGINVGKSRDFKDYFRWYNPRKPERHLQMGLSALRALVREDIPANVREDDARRNRRLKVRRAPE
jgi:hypothetical protein